MKKETTPSPDPRRALKAATLAELRALKAAIRATLVNIRQATKTPPG